MVVVFLGSSQAMIEDGSQEVAAQQDFLQTHFPFAYPTETV